MNSILRHIRLLPMVIVVGFALLTVKGFGLLHEAQAEAAGDAAPSEQTPFQPPAPASDDPAADDTEMASASEVDVLTSLTKRRVQLDEREQQIAMRENVITAAEKRVDDKITQLQALQAEIQKLLGQRDAEEQKQIASLVKTYSAMKAKDAARIFDTLDSDVRIAVAQQMKSDVLAPILAAMQADQAQKITVAIANRLKVTPPPVPPATAPGAPAPDGTQAANPAAPTTTAAAAPAATPPAATPPAADPAKTADATPKTTPIHTPRPHKPKPTQTAAAPATAPVQTAATKPTATPPAANPAAQAPAQAPAHAPTQTPATTPPAAPAANTPAPAAAKPGG